MGYQFEDVGADIPGSIPEIDGEISSLVGDMAEIDVQFVFYKSAPDASRDATWHGRALAAKGHMMRRVRALRQAKAEMLEAGRLANAAARKALMADRDRIAAERAAQKQEAWRQRFHDLQHWMWDAFPEHREALIAETARLKKSDAE
jgi:uncharacterized caspase-like protein